MARYRHRANPKLKWPILFPDRNGRKSWPQSSPKETRPRRLNSHPFFAKIKSPAGVEIFFCLGILTLYFQNTGWRFLLMAVSGMVARNICESQRTTENTGEKRFPET